MNRRRLLMTVDAVGGVWTYALELATALAPLGYETMLALLGPAATVAQRAEAARIPSARLIDTGLPLDWLAADAAAVGGTARAIAALAKAERADLVQLNQPALAAAAHYPAPIVAAVHSCVATWWAATSPGEPEPDAFGWQTTLVGEGLARADAVVCPSEAFAGAVQRRYRLRTTPGTVHNGRTPIAAASGASQDFAFTAGRLWDRGKNLATLDRAAARSSVPVRAAGPLTGPNGDRIALAHIDAPGSLDAAGLAACLSARPVFVSTAQYEPFGLAVLEAAQTGCALVLSDIPTFRELWRDAAIFVAPDDADGFATAIEALIQDRAARADRGARALLAADRFTPARMAGGMAAIYDRLLGADARAAA